MTVFALEIACSRLSDSGEDAKEKGTRKVGGAGKSPRSSHFPPVCAFSIQWTLLSRSLEQATLETDNPSSKAVKIDE